MKVISIKDKLNKYNVVIGDDGFKDFLEMFNFPTKVMVITTKKILSLCDKAILDKGFDFFFVGESELEKSYDNYLEITKALLEKEYAKSDLILAIGGGVITDLAGFIAATYKRGINLINVPTTLLSMVDASIGGKNGIDYLGYKNVLGTIYAPNMVVVSLEFLKDLSDKEFLSGLMECLKAGIIGDKELYSIIKEHNLKEIRNNIFLIYEIITRSIEVKKHYVELDPYEMDKRRILNLGHTVGHAIESLNIGKITHGEAIALGMIPFLGSHLQEEVKDILNKYLDKVELNLNKDKLIEKINEDKKIKNNQYIIVYANDINDLKINEISKDDMREKLDEINIWQ